MIGIFQRGQIISRRVGFVVVLAMVLARSFAALYWSDVHFDADQAVMGLMAKHIAEGRAFPVFQYAATYVLVLEAWLAAPLMAISEASPTLLKSVPVALNAATALLLFAILTRGSQALSPAMALLPTAPLALPGVTASTDLVSAIGMNIEPAFFGLVFWLLRQQPIVLGIVAAIAVKNREFALYALSALIFVELLRDRSVALWRPRLTGVIAFAVTSALVTVVNEYSSPMGPATTMAMPGSGGDNFSRATGAMCIELDKIPGDLRVVATEILPLQWGVSSDRWRSSGFTTAQPPDAMWLWWPVVAVLLFGIWRGLVRAWRLGPTDLTWFGLYLVLTGLQSVVVYGSTRCGHASVFTMRYTLLSLFIAAGAMVLGLERESKLHVRAAIISVCVVWIGVCAAGHLIVVRGLVASPPVGSYRRLAEYLNEKNVRYIVTDYWTGYHVAFLTGERVKAFTDFNRIQDYMLAVRANMDQAVEIRRLTELPCTGADVVSSFYVCPPPPR